MDPQDNPFLRYHLNSQEKNPFQGSLSEAIRYDYINCTILHEKINNFFSKQLPIYEYSASFLVEVLEKEYGGYLWRKNILDLGCGTGAATRMLCQSDIGQNILAIDQSAAMLDIARYKFNQNGQLEPKLQEEDIPQRLLKYWKEVQQETKDNKREKNVRFIQEDLREIDSLVNDKDSKLATTQAPQQEYHAAIANHSLHWLGDDFGHFFGKMQKVLHPQGIIIWNSASDFVRIDDAPTEHYSLRYNDIMGMICEVIEKKGIPLENYTEFRKPQWTVKEIQQMTAAQGFETTQRGLILVRNDFQRFFSFDVPLMLTGLLKEKGSMKIEDIEQLSREAIAQVIRTRADFAKDIQHKYDLNPIFVSKMMKS